VSNQRADFAVLQVVSLLTLDASTKIVDSSTDIISRLNARTSRIIVEVLSVAFSAVEIIHVRKATS